MVTQQTDVGADYTVLPQNYFQPTKSVGGTKFTSGQVLDVISSKNYESARTVTSGAGGLKSSHRPNALSLGMAESEDGKPLGAEVELSPPAHMMAKLDQFVD